MNALLLRIVLSFVFIIAGIVFFVEAGWLAAMPIFIALIIIWATYISFGTVSQALSLLRKGDLALASAKLKETKFPKQLVQYQKANYHFVDGMVDLLHTKQVDTGYQKLQMALQFGLQNPHDKSMAMLHLAQNALKKNDKSAVQHWITQLEQLNSNDLLVKEQIGKLKGLV